MDPVQWMKDATTLLKDAGRVDLSAEILELSKANIELERKVLELEHRVRLREEMVWRGNTYWKKDDPSDGPYCSKCADVDHNSVRMHDIGHQWRRPACRTHVRKPGQHEQPEDFPLPRDPV